MIVPINTYLCNLNNTRTMSDNHTPEQRHHNMAAVHSASTTPELKLRRALWRLGFRYGVNVKRLPGSPDIVLSKYHTAIFVHGCFWHGHKDCKNASIPKTNTDYWTAKITRNQQRDQEVWRQLEAKGWFVIIVWECQLKKARLQETVELVADEIRKNGEIYQSIQSDRRIARASYMHERRIHKEHITSLLTEIQAGIK